MYNKVKNIRSFSIKEFQTEESKETRKKDKTVKSDYKVAQETEMSQVVPEVVQAINGGDNSQLPSLLRLLGEQYGHRLTPEVISQLKEVTAEAVQRELIGNPLTEATLHFILSQGRDTEWADLPAAIRRIARQSTVGFSGVIGNYGNIAGKVVPTTKDEITNQNLNIVGQGTPPTAEQERVRMQQFVQQTKFKINTIKRYKLIETDDPVREVNNEATHQYPPGHMAIDFEHFGGVIKYEPTYFINGPDSRCTNVLENMYTNKSMNLGSYKRWLKMGETHSYATGSLTGQASRFQLLLDVQKEVSKLERCQDRIPEYMGFPTFVVDGALILKTKSISDCIASIRVQLMNEGLNPYQSVLDYNSASDSGPYLERKRTNGEVGIMNLRFMAEQIIFNLMHDVKDMTEAQLVQKYIPLMLGYLKPKAEIITNENITKKVRNIVCLSAPMLAILQLGQNTAENNRRGWKHGDPIQVFHKDSPPSVTQIWEFVLSGWSPKDSFFSKLLRAMTENEKEGMNIMFIFADNLYIGSTYLAGDAYLWAWISLDAEKMECSHNSADSEYYADLFMSLNDFPEEFMAAYKFVFKHVAINGKAIWQNRLVDIPGLSSGVTGTSGLNTIKMMEIAAAVLAVMGNNFAYHPNLGRNPRKGLKPGLTLVEMWDQKMLNIIANFNGVKLSPGVDIERDVIGTIFKEGLVRLDILGHDMTLFSLPGSEKRFVMGSLRMDSLFKGALFMKGGGEPSKTIAEKIQEELTTMSKAVSLFIQGGYTTDYKMGDVLRSMSKRSHNRLLSYKVNDQSILEAINSGLVDLGLSPEMIQQISITEDKFISMESVMRISLSPEYFQVYMEEVRAMDYPPEVRRLYMQVPTDQYQSLPDFVAATITAESATVVLADDPAPVQQLKQPTNKTEAKSTPFQDSVLEDFLRNITISFQQREVKKDKQHRAHFRYPAELFSLHRSQRENMDYFLGDLAEFQKDIIHFAIPLNGWNPDMLARREQHDTLVSFDEITRVVENQNTHRMKYTVILKRVYDHAYRTWPKLFGPLVLSREYLQYCPIVAGVFSIERAVDNIVDQINAYTQRYFTLARKVTSSVEYDSTKNWEENRDRLYEVGKVLSTELASANKSARELGNFYNRYAHSIQYPTKKLGPTVKERRAQSQKTKKTFVKREDKVKRDPLRGLAGMLNSYEMVKAGAKSVQYTGGLGDSRNFPFKTEVVLVARKGVEEPSFMTYTAMGPATSHQLFTDFVRKHLNLTGEYMALPTTKDKFKAFKASLPDYASLTPVIQTLDPNDLAEYLSDQFGTSTMLAQAQKLLTLQLKAKANPIILRKLLLRIRAQTNVVLHGNQTVTERFNMIEDYVMANKLPARVTPAQLISVLRSLINRPVAVRDVPQVFNQNIPDMFSRLHTLIHNKSKGIENSPDPDYLGARSALCLAAVKLLGELGFKDTTENSGYFSAYIALVMAIPYNVRFGAGLLTPAMCRILTDVSAFSQIQGSAADAELSKLPTLEDANDEYAMHMEAWSQNPTDRQLAINLEQASDLLADVLAASYKTSEFFIDAGGNAQADIDADIKFQSTGQKPKTIKALVNTYNRLTSSANDSWKATRLSLDEFQQMIDGIRDSVGLDKVQRFISVVRLLGQTSQITLAFQLRQFDSKVRPPLQYEYDLAQDLTQIADVAVRYYNDKFQLQPSMLSGVAGLPTTYLDKAISFLGFGKVPFETFVTVDGTQMTEMISQMDIPPSLVPGRFKQLRDTHTPRLRPKSNLDDQSLGVFVANQTHSFQIIDIAHFPEVVSQKNFHLVSKNLMRLYGDMRGIIQLINQFSYFYKGGPPPGKAFGYFWTIGSGEPKGTVGGNEILDLAEVLEKIEEGGNTFLDMLADVRRTNNAMKYDLRNPLEATLMQTLNKYSAEGGFAPQNVYWGTRLVNLILEKEPGLQTSALATTLQETRRGFNFKGAVLSKIREDRKRAIEAAETRDLALKTAAETGKPLPKLPPETYTRTNLPQYNPQRSTPEEALIFQKSRIEAVSQYRKGKDKIQEELDLLHRILPMLGIEFEMVESQFSSMSSQDRQQVYHDLESLRTWAADAAEKTKISGSKERSYGQRRKDLILTKVRPKSVPTLEDAF